MNSEHFWLVHVRKCFHKSLGTFHYICNPSNQEISVSTMKLKGNEASQNSNTDNVTLVCDDNDFNK